MAKKPNWVENFKLPLKYRKVLDHLNNDQKAEYISKKFTKIEVLQNIFSYYEIDDSISNFIIRNAVLKKRNKDSWYLLKYSKVFIKDRWPESEPYLLKNLESNPHHLVNFKCCKIYKKKYIKGRWKELEKVICQKKEFYHGDFNSSLSNYVQEIIGWDSSLVFMREEHEQQNKRLHDMYNQILEEQNCKHFQIS